MKKIPIWQHHPKTITPEPTLSTLHPCTQLHPIHMDSLHEILTAKPSESEYSTALEQEQSEGPWRGGCSVVHERRTGRLVWLDFVVFGCLCVGGEYLLVVEDCVGRCVVVRYGVEQFVDRLRNTSRASILSILQQQPDNNLRPLRKHNPSLAQHGNKLYLAGSQPIYPWELTSPLWMYQLEQEQWTELEMEGQGESESEEWIVCVEGLVICVGGSYVRVRDVEGKGRKECIVSLTTSNEPIIDTHTDTFLTCTHKHPQTGTPHLLILIQTASPDRQPLLLELSLPHPSQPKPNGQMASQQIAIEVARYDLGVFLYEEGRLERLEKGTLGNGLWEIVNQVVYMQVVETAASFVQHSMSSTSNSNFIKKKQQHSHKQTSKKVQLLTLYTKTRKNPESSAPLIQLDTYQIKLSRLERIPFQAENKPLSYYFQKKQYCDLVFFAQKRQMHCSRQLFQFYSSKFKKLYSSSTRPEPPSSLSVPQKQTMVKLDHTKLSTIYFLVQHMYYNFALSTKQLDQGTLIDLMILSHKFQVLEMQVLCEQEVEISCANFNRLYDYFRNSETPRFRELFLRFFIIHAQEVIKIMPIGKVEELIRLVYSPECPHLVHTELKSKLENTYSIKDPETGELKQVHRSINYAGIIKSQEVTLKICLKCNRLLAFNQQSHRKNKSSIRGSSLGDFGHKKKDNKSN